jgi:hypothetical protein
LLETLNHYSATGKPVFGMNRGTVGFLLNTYKLKDLPERLDHAIAIKLDRLALNAITTQGETIRAKAINEVSLFRQSAQSAHLSITVDGNNRLPCLVCDGVFLSTPGIPPTLTPKSPVTKPCGRKTAEIMASTKRRSFIASARSSTKRTCNSNARSRIRSKSSATRIIASCVSRNWCCSSKVKKPLLSRKKLSIASRCAEM